MSTGTRRPSAQARADGVALRDLFPAACWTQWVGGGSVRRRRPDCGDVEHVIQPAFGEVEKGDGLFVERHTVNLLWHRLDELVKAGVVEKAVYGATGHRWGEKYRGVLFRGFKHELYTADADNWGSVLAIRTGPAEFSTMLVSRLLFNGLRNHEGYVWRCRPCEHCNDGEVESATSQPSDCRRCNGTGLYPDERLSVPTEERFFSLAGVPYRSPEDRK